MLSRDSILSENNKKSFNKNGNTFCCELLNRTGLGLCVMQAPTKRCLAFSRRIFFSQWRSRDLISALSHKKKTLSNGMRHYSNDNYKGEPFLTTFLRSPEPFYMNVGYVFELTNYDK